MIKINCKTCVGIGNSSCKAIADSGGFAYWGCLERFIANHQKPKWLGLELIEAAREFVSEYRFTWQGGLCICDAPYGNYIWHFAVRIKQEKLWGYKEFIEGFEFGKNPVEPLRDANPYQEFSRNNSWDCGYILGLCNQEYPEMKA